MSQLYIYTELDSTNNYANEQIAAGLAEMGDGIMTLNQIAGKGQRGNKWVGNADENIYLSIIQEINKPIDDVFKINCIASIIVKNIIEKYIKTQNIFIKWPNDIIINNKKIAGILIENNITNNIINYSIIGIGINVNQLAFNDIDNKATSLYKESNKKIDIIQLANEIHKSFNQNFSHFFKSQNLIEIYNEDLYKLNDFIKIDFNNTIENIKCIGVDVSGNFHGLINEEKIILTKHLGMIYD